MPKHVPFSSEDVSKYREIFHCPEEWTFESAQFAFNEVRDGTHDSPKKVDEGVPLVTSKNLNNGKVDLSTASLISKEDHQEISKRSKVSEGDILFSMIGTIGNTCLIDEKPNFSIKNVALFRENASIVFPKFGYYWLKSDTYQKFLESKQRGGNQKFLSLGVLRDSPIILPPILEQKRIADKLDLIFEKLEMAKSRLEKVPQLLKRFRMSVLSTAVSGELTEEWRDVNNADGWEHVSLKQVGKGFNYGSSAKSKKEGSVPVLRMGNLQDGKLDWSDLVYTSDEKEIEKYKLEAGDVLFNRTNSPELVGKTSIYRGEREAIFAGYLIKVQGTGRLNSEYLNIQLNSPHARDYCWQVKTDGVSQSNINAQKLKAYESICLLSKSRKKS